MALGYTSSLNSLSVWLTNMRHHKPVLSKQVDLRIPTTRYISG